MRAGLVGRPRASCENDQKLFQSPPPSKAAAAA